MSKKTELPELSEKTIRMKKVICFILKTDFDYFIGLFLNIRK